jgi:hypothetical protein
MLAFNIVRICFHGKKIENELKLHEICAVKGLTSKSAEFLYLSMLLIVNAASTPEEASVNPFPYAADCIDVVLATVRSVNGEAPI